MAINYQVNILLSGSSNWNYFRQRYPSTSVDLSLLILKGVFPKRLNMSEIDMHGGMIHESNFSETVFSDARLNESDWSTLECCGCWFRGAAMYRSEIRNSVFRECDFRGADLRACTIKNVIFKDTDLTSVDFNRTYFENVEFSGVRFGGNNFTGVSFSNCTGVDTAVHVGSSLIDHRTVIDNPDLPRIFLERCGIPELLLDYFPSIIRSPISFYSCFISYSHEDIDFVRKLHSHLENKGIRCWLDEHKMVPGEDIYDSVDRGIKLWDKTLLCCSRSSLSSWWVDNEIDSAFSKERKLMKERKKKTLALIPIDIDGYLFSDVWQSGKRNQIRSRLAADFKGWDTRDGVFEHAFGRLLKGLASNSENHEAIPPSLL